MPALTLALFGVTVAAILNEVWYHHNQKLLKRRRASWLAAELNKQRSIEEMTGDFCAIADRIAAEDEYLKGQE